MIAPLLPFLNLAAEGPSEEHMSRLLHRRHLRLHRDSREASRSGD